MGARGAEQTAGSLHAVPSDEDLVARVWSGDDDAMSVLLDRYRRYVRAKARQYFLAGGEHDDVVQEGMIGLYKAIRDFRPGEDQRRFLPFADVCVTRQILSAVRAATRNKHQPLNTAVPLPSPAEHDEAGWESRIAAGDVDPASYVVSAAERAAIEAHCRKVLTSLELQVLQRYTIGESYEEIAAALGRNARTVDNALQRIKRKVDAYLRT